MATDISDEPLTAEEIRALDEAAASRNHEKTTSHEEFLAELGITKEEIDNFQEPTSKTIRVSPSLLEYD